MKNTLALASLFLALSLGADAAVTYSSGHGDIGLEYGGAGTLALHAHLHAGAVVDGVPLIADNEYEPEDIVFQVSASALSAISDPALVAGTGVLIGNSVWTLPEVDNPLLPFLGFGVEELDPADWTTNLSYTLASIMSPSGTGHFSVYQSDGLGGYNFLMSTALGGITSGDKVEMVAGSHDHFNFAFSEAGTWTVNFSASGTHITDGLQTSAPQSFTFNVIPEPSRAILMAFGFMGLIFRRRR